MIHISRGGNLVAQGNLGAGEATGSSERVFDIAVDDIAYAPAPTSGRSATAVS